MSFATLFTPEIIALGLAIGVVLGATGAGGGIFSVPLLTITLHLTVNQASPIALLAVTVASGVAAILGLIEGIVRYKAAVLMATVGLCLSPIGFALARQLPNTPLVLLFVALLIWVAIRMWRKTVDTEVASLSADQASAEFPCTQSAATGKFIWTLPCARALILTGGVAGFLSGLIGVGGGFIIVPSLRAHTNLVMRSVVATSLAVIALVSAGGVIVAANQGSLDWLIALPFAMGTILGMLAGRFVGKHLSQQTLSRGFAILALLAAALMLQKLFFHSLN
ncbi:MAG: sulfite exporter TauE/SafE family protein [Cytophagales bacterium]|nr:sulfite exporter TauE/SafE family protein [Cytophagales bacterium]